MWFKNLQIYRLPSPWAMTAEQLAEQLARGTFVPTSCTEPRCRGCIHRGQPSHARWFRRITSVRSVARSEGVARVGNRLWKGVLANCGNDIVPKPCWAKRHRAG